MPKKLSFSQYEMWFLLLHFSPSVVIGFQDPIKRLLSNEIPQLRDNAWKNLFDRWLIHSSNGNGFTIDASIRDQIKLIANPDHSFLAGIQTAQNGSVGCAF